MLRDPDFDYRSDFDMDSWGALVSVVEAAEDPGLADIFDDTTMYPAQKRLAAALTALREHLEGGDVT